MNVCSLPNKVDTVASVPFVPPGEVKESLATSALGAVKFSVVLELLLPEPNTFSVVVVVVPPDSEEVAPDPSGNSVLVLTVLLPSRLIVVVTIVLLPLGFTVTVSVELSGTASETL